MSEERAASTISERTRSAVLHEVAMVIRRCQHNPDADAELSGAARLLCEDTRRRSLPIERAIIDLKTTLLTEAPDLTSGGSLSVMRARVIQMTIEEYYRA
jgi:hypothetical protein